MFSTKILPVWWRQAWTQRERTELTTHVPGKNIRLGKGTFMCWRHIQEAVLNRNTKSYCSLIAVPRTRIQLTVFDTISYEPCNSVQNILLVPQSINGRKRKHRSKAAVNCFPTIISNTKPRPRKTIFKSCLRHLRQMTGAFLFFNHFI